MITATTVYTKSILFTLPTGQQIEVIVKGDDSTTRAQLLAALSAAGVVTR